MIKILMAVLGIILLFVAVAGCTLEDETVKIVITDTVTIEPTDNSTERIGIINLTFQSDSSDEVPVKEQYFKIVGELIIKNNTSPVLFITNFTIHGENVSDVLEKGEKRTVTIEHIQFPNVRVKSLTYEYSNLEMAIDLLKNERKSEIVVQPSFFKTNYFIFILVFGTSLLMLAALLGRARPPPEVKRNVCKFCLEDLSQIDDKNKLYCKKWKGRTRRCGEGPFCSERCLQYHWEDEEHEN
jgi:hypothetical protein